VGLILATNDLCAGIIGLYYIGVLSTLSSFVSSLNNLWWQFVFWLNYLDTSLRGVYFKLVSASRCISDKLYVTLSLLLLYCYLFLTWFFSSNVFFFKKKRFPITSIYIIFYMSLLWIELMSLHRKMRLSIICTRSAVL
jgi:hypothetical protein